MAPHASPSDRRPRFWPLVAAAAFGLGAVAFILWPGMPSIHQDEYLPLFPITWFTKEPAARSSGLYPYTREAFGTVFPVLSYPYLGAVKAYAYLALGLPTTPGAYRLLQLALLGVLVVLVVRVCWRLSGRSAFACAVCLALLLADTGVVTLGILDEGNQIPNLVFGTLLVLCLSAIVEAPRAWQALPLALVVAVGELDRVNFVWFVGAGLAGCAATAVAGPVRRSLRVLAVATVGCALGLAAAVVVVPDYPSKIGAGMQQSIPTFDVPGLWEHWGVLFAQLDPLSAYHRYVDARAPAHGGTYALYRWTWTALFAAVVASAAVLGLARARRDPEHPERARPLLFLAAFAGALLFVIVKTKESWSAHHVFLVKPFAYVALGLLAAEAARGPRARRPVVGVVALLAVGSAWAGARAHRDMLAASPIFGVYDVGPNQSEAWRAAAESGATTVYALDWGVFYPGVLNSPPGQHWEAPAPETPEAAQALLAARAGTETAVLFHTRGSFRWLLEGPRARARFGMRDVRQFERHPGEPWTLALLNAQPEAPAPDDATDGPNDDLLVNGDFGDGTFAWRYEELEEVPNTADLTVEECEIEGGRRPCVRLTHRAPATSRALQDVSIPPKTTVAVSAAARVDGVGSAARGAHLMLVREGFGSGDIRGTTGWYRLRFSVTNPHDEARSVRFAARLGFLGSLNTGSAWFADVSVRRAATPDPSAPSYVLP
jgi:hypothetical protein